MLNAYIVWAHDRMEPQDWQRFVGWVNTVPLHEQTASSFRTIEG